jgi:hypothetical protein
MSAPFNVEKTLPMTVKQTGFLVDRLGQDCAPLQFLRELTKNSIEAILRTPDRKGEVVWDVDWDTHDLAQQYKLCIMDNGVGMTGDEMAGYINALSSSVHLQSHEGNFGVGAKIAAATRNHAGLLYLSWKDGEGSMIHLWRDPETEEYGLRQLRPADDSYAHWAGLEDTVKPPLVDNHGTKVVLLGMTEDQDTMQAPPGAASPSAWVSKYLNTRFFRFPEGVTVKAREGWTFPRTDQKNNVMRTIKGQAAYLEEHCESHGQVELQSGIAHWWILRDENAISQNSGRFASSGHTAALHNDELYEMQSGRAGVARLQLFGVIFGHQRVVIYVEPTTDVGSNTARTQLLIGGEPLPWADWAAEFRDLMPHEIRTLMEEVTAGALSGDHRQAIRERLRQIRDLLKISRYRPTPQGDKLTETENGRGGGGEGSSEESSKRSSSSGSSGSKGGRAGNIYGLFLREDGQPAEEAGGQPEPEVTWVSVEKGTRTPGDMEDRAAKYLYEQNKLLINADFRVYQDMIDRWHTNYSDVPGSRDVIVSIVQEWFEQSLIETVLGAQALHGPRWSVQDVRDVLSEHALTASILPRYHIDVAVKRAVGSKLGSLRERMA